MTDYTFPMNKADHAMIALGPKDTPVPETAVSPKSETVEMVERVARAIDPIRMGVPTQPGDVIGEFQRETVRAVARAAIEAMREPTEAMADAVEMNPDNDSGLLKYPGPYTTWRAMIDAALNPGELS